MLKLGDKLSYLIIELGYFSHMIVDDIRSYIVFCTMFMSFELSSGDFV